MDETNFLKIVLDGEVVAEAVLRIYDPQAAWLTFQEGFAEISPHLVGEVFNTVRVATHPDLQAVLGEQGIVIDLKGRE